MSSEIMMITPNTSTVLTGGIIPLTTIARRSGCAVSGTTNSITLNRAGYYKVSGTITFVGSATGDAIVALQKSGVSVPGIESALTVGAATTVTYTLPISGIVRVFCCEQSPILTIANTGVGIVTSNVELDVEYLG